MIRESCCDVQHEVQPGGRGVAPPSRTVGRHPHWDNRLFPSRNGWTHSLSTAFVVAHTLLDLEAASHAPSSCRRTAPAAAAAAQCCRGLGKMLDYDNSAFYYFMITMLAIYLVGGPPPLFNSARSRRRRCRLRDGRRRPTTRADQPPHRRRCHHRGRPARRHSPHPLSPTFTWHVRPALGDGGSVLGSARLVRFWVAPRASIRRGRSHERSAAAWRTVLLRGVGTKMRLVVASGSLRRRGVSGRRYKLCFCRSRHTS